MKTKFTPERSSSIEPSTGTESKGFFIRLKDSWDKLPTRDKVYYGSVATYVALSAVDAYQSHYGGMQGEMNPLISWTYYHFGLGVNETKLILTPTVVLVMETARRMINKFDIEKGYVGLNTVLTIGNVLSGLNVTAYALATYLLYR